MEAYAAAVEAGEVLACDALKKAVARYRRDQKAAKKKGASWVFDAEAAKLLRREYRKGWEYPI